MENLKKNLQRWVACFATVGIMTFGQTALASCDGQSLYLCDSQFESFLQDYASNCELGDRVTLKMLDC